MDLQSISPLQTIRFATSGGEPKEAHRIPLGLPKQTQTHSLTCSLPKVANTYGGEGSEPQNFFSTLIFVKILWPNFHEKIPE